MFCACLAVRFRSLNQVRDRRADLDTDAAARAQQADHREPRAPRRRAADLRPVHRRPRRLAAKETHADPSDIAPWVAANAMLGLCRALVTHVRQRVLAGERDRARLARELRARARQAAALLERGSVSSAAEEPASAIVVCVRPRAMSGGRACGHGPLRCGRIPRPAGHRTGVRFHRSRGGLLRAPACVPLG
jgi:hypothetical protein